VNNKSNNTSTIIIDGNNLFFKAFAVNQNKILKQEPGANELGAVYITLTSVRRCLNKFKYKEAFITWDKPVFKGSHYRYTLTKNQYKINRKPKPENFYVLLDHCVELCKYLGVKTILPYRLEADDVVSYIALKSEKPCIICTGDNDLLQLLVHEGISVYNTSKDVLINKHNILAYYPVEAENVIRYKAFLGDTADNIDGLDGYGEKKSVRIFENYTESINKLTTEQKEKVLLNQKIISLGYGLTCDEHRSSEIPFLQKQLDEQKNLKPDYDTFFAKCEKYGFDAIYKDKSRWRLIAEDNRMTGILTQMFESLIDK
jgi:5'-3' exonuclease